MSYVAPVTASTWLRSPWLTASSLGLMTRLFGWVGGGQRSGLGSVGQFCGSRVLGSRWQVEVHSAPHIFTLESQLREQLFAWGRQIARE